MYMYFIDILVCTNILVKEFSVFDVLHMMSSVCTQDYVYPDARDRQFLNFFHRIARNHKFDTERYVNNTES